MEKKYKLTNEYIIINNHILYRIEALKDFSDVEKGDKGGFIESEDNLSQYNNCWVYDDAMVCSDAKVCDNAAIYGDSKVFDNARICDNAIVFNNAKIFDNAMISCNAIVYGNTTVYNNAKVFDNAKIFSNAIVRGNARIFGNAVIYDRTVICNNVKVYGKAVVTGDSKICDDAIIYGNANIFNARINGNAKVASISDYIVFKNWWSSGRYFTWTRSNNMWSVGCFYGTGEELIAKAYKDSELSGREYKRVVEYVESILNVED